jgi:2-oxoglutarate dehydrogenase E1 component
VWAQEEPKNMGAWSYVQPRLETALRELPAAGGEAAGAAAAAGGGQQRVRYVGRPAAASPATASFAIHQRETLELVEAALL